MVAACGGGGGGSASVPATPLGVVPASGPSPAAFNTETAPVVIVVGQRAPAGERRLHYISPSTKSMAIAVTSAKGTTTTSADCAASCSATVNAPVGAVTFKVSLYSAAGGGGSVLSTGSTSATIVGGQTNTISLVFGGVISTLAVNVDTSALVGGTPATIPVSIVTKDAGGNVIVGGDAFATPITLAESDTTGVMSLSSTQVSSPSTTVNLAYNGGSVGATTITATAGTVSSSASVKGANASGTVNISLPVPSPVPSHVLTYYYYGASNINTAIPASFMAAHADFVEMSEQQASLVNAYKSAGGKHALVYSDPTYQPYCVAPLTAAPFGACSGPIAAYIGSEAGWYHTSTGARVYRPQGGSTTNYQEAVNLGSSVAQSAYTSFTNNILAQAPALDYFFADDSGTSYANSGGDPMTGLFYRFNAPAVEVTSATAYQAQEKAMLAAASRPVFINGGDVETWKPAYNGAFITAPNVAGEIFEGCIGMNGGTLMTDANGYFQQEENALLAATGYGRYAVCMMYGTMTPATRTYLLASWWLTYDPTWSLVAPINTTSDGYATFAEHDIVPRSPLKTATTDVGVLRSSASGPYVREFAQCYQAGVSIGGCAAVVNTTASAAAMPAMTGTYSAMLTLNDASSYTTGTATWTASVPASLPAGSAVILRQ